METRKPPTERNVIEWLQKGRIELPPLRLQFTKAEPQYDGCRWDFELEVKWGKQKATFAVEYKAQSTPKAFAEALRRCQDARLPRGTLPLLLLPYLRSTQLEELEESEISGIDLCGNGIVIIPDKLRVFRTGARNQFATYAPIKNIYRKNTSMVARLFAAQSSFPNVGAIRDEVNDRNPLVKNGSRTPMQLGTVSKALKGLEEDLIIERSKTIRLLQADKLLSQLVESYEPPRATRRMRLKVNVAGQSLSQWLGGRLDDVPMPVVASGLSSVTRYAVMARDDMLTFYCPRLDELTSKLGGVEANQFPNLELIETDEQPLFFDSRWEDNLEWASPLQTYLELMAGDKRDKETAEQVKSLLLRTMKGGNS